jgi:hypothetical protein
MSSTRQEHATLAYYEPSPVRGQLEPYEPQSRAGWRYLQCTDTPNELKVRHTSISMPLLIFCLGLVAPQNCTPLQPTPPARGF